MGNNQAQMQKHPEFSEIPSLKENVQFKEVDKHGVASATHWQTIALSLDMKQLSLQSDSVEVVLTVNDRFEVLKESSNLQCLMISSLWQLQDYYCMLKFDSLHSFLQWSQKLKEAKRPKWQGLETLMCGVCALKFTVLRRQHHCRSCGRAVCGSCSPVLAILPHLGYSNFQRVCLRCGSHLQRMTVPRLGRRRPSLPGIRVNKGQLERSLSEVRSRKRDRASVPPIAGS